MQHKQWANALSVWRPFLCPLSSVSVWNADKKGLNTIIDFSSLVSRLAYEALHPLHLGPVLLSAHEYTSLAQWGCTNPHLRDSHTHSLMGGPATESTPDNTLSSPQATETDGEAKPRHNQSTGTMKPFHFQVKETLYENKFWTIFVKMLETTTSTRRLIFP